MRDGLGAWVGYWAASVGLIVFGLLGILSIGRPFLLVGLAMFILGPLRSRAVVFWPPLMAVIAYNVGYLAVAPFYCTATQAVGGPSTTTCSNLIGINYSGSGTYNPSLEPANQAGLLLSAIVFLVVLAMMFWRERRTPAP